MSVTALELAEMLGVAADAFVGEAARAPSTTAIRTWRDPALAGRNRRILWILRERTCHPFYGLANPGISLPVREKVRF
jgi:hypothetical protein